MWVDVVQEPQFPGLSVSTPSARTTARCKKLVFFAKSLFGPQQLFSYFDTNDLKGPGEGEICRLSAKPDSSQDMETGLLMPAAILVVIFLG